MGKDYRRLVAEKLKKEGLTPVGGPGLRLEGFRGSDRVLVKFRDDGRVSVNRRREGISSIFRRRGKKSVIRLERFYSPKELERTLRKNGIEWLGFDEKDILLPVYDDDYPGRENFPADAVVYLRDQNTARVSVKSEAAALWCSGNGLFGKKDFPGYGFSCDNADMKALVDNMRRRNLKVLVRPRAFWMTRSYYGGPGPFYGDAPR